MLLRNLRILICNGSFVFYLKVMHVDRIAKLFTHHQKLMECCLLSKGSSRFQEQISLPYIYLKQTVFEQ